MPVFGEKRFKKREKVEIRDALTQPSASSFMHTVTVNKQKELVLDYDLIANEANSIFGFNGWSHCVTYQSIDFIDFDKTKYDVGVSVLVKVMLKDGTFHEEVGYGISKGLKCKGNAIAKAKKTAVNDGLRNALRAFGNCFNSSQRTGKITDFMSLSQQSRNDNDVIVTGNKRKSSQEINSNSTIIEQMTISSAEPSTSQPPQKKIASRTVALDTLVLCSQTSSPSKQVTSTQSSSSQCYTYHEEHEDTQANFPNSENINTSSQITPFIKGSPIDKDKIRRKCKQLQLEIEAREKYRRNLMAQLEDTDEKELFSPFGTLFSQ